MRKNLTKKEIIRKRDDIKNLFSNKNIKIGVKNLNLFILKNNFDFNRIIFCPAKKYGNAVQRNRAKRIFREIYRMNKDLISKNFDFALIIYPGKDDFKEREEEFKNIFKKAKLFC